MYYTVVYCVLMLGRIHTYSFLYVFMHMYFVVFKINMHIHCLVFMYICLYITWVIYIYSYILFGLNRQV